MKTQTFIVLLRGINVSGQKLIKMEALRQAFADAGYADARTYIQSGNILLKSEEDAEAVRQKTVTLIKNRFNFEVGVVVLDLDELRLAVEHVPFEGEGNKIYLGFLSAVPAKSAADAWESLDTGVDQSRLHGRILYVRYGDSAGKSKLTNLVIEKKLAVVSTMRNLNTARKLLELGPGL